MDYLDRRIVSLVPEDAKVIPGHGAQASISDVRRSTQCQMSHAELCFVESVRNVNLMSPICFAWDSARAC